MNDHYVRHMLRPGGDVSTEYQCRADEGATCRVTCRRCYEASEEQCMCGYYDREPDEQDIGRCLILDWLTESYPDELFNGEPQPIRGPDWQPIVPEWTGDNYDWDYAPDDVAVSS